MAPSSLNRGLAQPGMPYASGSMAPSRLDFRIDAQASGSRARAATFRTLHGPVETPIFMPVGTQAAVRAQSPQSLAAAGSQVLLANTYHLLLRPGAEVFRRMGGIHRFMSWPGPVLTDSGGYQIFSLPHSREVTEEGALFQSYVDGRTVRLSPELSIETQVAIGSDIMMVLDQCVSAVADRATARAALDLTHRWAARSLDARGDSPQSLFGIVQGALFADLRRESVLCLSGHALRRPGHRRPGGGRGARPAAGRVRADRRADAPGPAPVPHGRGHAPRPARGRAPRPRHVRLHPADGPRRARRGLHLAGVPPAPPGRAQARGRGPRPGLLLPDLPAPLARLSPPPDEDRRGAGVAAAGAAQPALLPPAHARDPAEHPGRHVRLPLRAEASAAG